MFSRSHNIQTKMNASKKTGLTLFDFSESLTFEVSLEYLTSSFGWPKYLWVTMRICFSRTPGDPKIVNGYKERL